MNHQNLLEVKHVTKKLVPNSKKDKNRKSFVLDNFNFAIEPGYIVGVVGRNGSGKTTLLNTILGLYKQDAGHICVNGYDKIQNSVEVKKSVAFITDECLFPLDLSVKNIGKMFGPLYDHFDMGKFWDYCKRFEIPVNKTLRNQSKGMKIKVQLAFALSYDAKLYILDEATAGLDPVFRKELVNIFFQIIEDGTRSILLATHLTEDLDKIADYILYIEEGRQGFFLEKEELLSKYQIIRGSKNQVNYYKKYILGRKDEEVYSEALIEVPQNSGQEKENLFPVPVERKRPTIEEILTYFMKTGKGW